MPKAKWLVPSVGAAVLVLIGVLWLTGTLNPDGEGPLAPTSPKAAVPIALKMGEAFFGTHCASCHGAAAVGTDQGPSLLWRIYAPSHHSDDSFYLAVQHGVRAHHWRFGNMAPIPAVSRDQVAQIVAYVRWLQQQVGVR